MTDSGEPDQPPPSEAAPQIPAWAPEQTPADQAHAAPDGPAGGSMVPPEYAPTMRLIPVPPASTPPPAYSAVATPEAGPGERYIGKYRVKGELGRGGMGTVYLAEQPGLGREVAIKQLIASAAADPVALKRFLQEAQVMARTSHPNLVQVHDLELIGEDNYIVLEFVRGKSLRERINEGMMPQPQVFAVIHAVLQALEYAHKHGIVHRDMKPENVLLSDEGTVKVADFGIARLMDDTGAGGTATKTGTTVGTPQYMSPEQVASSKVDGRSDLYSAGIVFYELVVGQPPFTSSDADGPFTLMAKHVQAPPKPPSVYRPGLDPELETVILKSLAKRPDDRYQTGHEFDEAMSRVADRLCPGWQRSLEPGVDLSRMALSPPQPPKPATWPPMPPAVVAAHPEMAAPPNPVYNPTPPVKPVVKASSGCLGLVSAVLVVAAVVAMTLGAIR
ncbi:MAG: serine/threonine-protein kinase [Candidatus Dormibacterales bacterium]